MILPGLLFLAALSVIFRLGPARPLWASPSRQASPQEAQKPKYDYMSGVLSRSTQPLGLKENPGMKEMLAQGPVRWALRAGRRHVLN
ncbi:MAG: hypothetical protein ABSG19_06055 [Candidatus Aminicenantales bacterium]